MVGLLMVFVLWATGAILGSGYGIQGQNYVALVQGREISAGFHNGSLVLGI